MTAVNTLWLPPGLHWNMHIEHKQLPDAGAFTTGAPKMIWHTTESAWESVDAMWETLRDKDAAPHVVIGARKGTKKPVAIQCIPFNRAGRALAHPAGTPETNRAGAIQIEVCWRASQMSSFKHYQALANLAVLIEHRVPIARKCFHDFESGCKRLSPAGFVQSASQHLGHMHVPNNDHVDPGNFNIAKLFQLCESAPNEL